MHESSLLQTTQALVVGKQVLECVSSSACVASGVQPPAPRYPLQGVDRRNYDQLEVNIELNNPDEVQPLVNGPAEGGNNQ